MTREEAIEILDNRLITLKEKGVSEMMHEGRADDLKALAIELGEDFFYAINEFIGEEESIKSGEIDPNYIFELIWYYLTNGMFTVREFFTETAFSTIYDILRNEYEDDELAKHMREKIKDNNYYEFIEDDEGFEDFEDEAYLANLKALIGA